MRINELGSLFAIWGAAMLPTMVMVMVKI